MCLNPLLLSKYRNRKFRSLFRAETLPENVSFWPSMKKKDVIIGLCIPVEKKPSGLFGTSGFCCETAHSQTWRSASMCLVERAHRGGYRLVWCLSSHLQPLRLLSISVPSPIYSGASDRDGVHQERQPSLHIHALRASGTIKLWSHCASKVLIGKQ